MSCEDSWVSISGLDKLDVLIALYNNHPMSLFTGHKLSREEASHIAQEQEWNFDYVNDIALKTNIAGDTFHSGCYDRDTTEGFAAQIVSKLKK
jgi:hypothetical protein